MGSNKPSVLRGFLGLRPTQTQGRRVLSVWGVQGATQRKRLGDLGWQTGATEVLIALVLRRRILR